MASDEEVATWVRGQLRSGYWSLDEVVANAPQYFEDESIDATALAGAVYAELALERASWPAVTDCDRLDGAFAALEDGGVIARPNFTCCNTCGHAEIGDEVANAEDDGRDVAGYVFFHMQDTDRVVESGTLLLRFGSTDVSNDAAVGTRIVDAVRAAGLSVSWNGDAGSAITVDPVRWQRRPA